MANGELSLHDALRTGESGWSEGTANGEFIFTPGAEDGSSSGVGRRFKGSITLKRAAGDGVYVEFAQFMDATRGDPVRAQMQILDIVFKAQSASRCKVTFDP